MRGRTPERFGRIGEDGSDGEEDGEDAAQEAGDTEDSIGLGVGACCAPNPKSPCPAVSGLWRGAEGCSLDAAEAVLDKKLLLSEGWWLLYGELNEKLPKDERSAKGETLMLSCMATLPLPDSLEVGFCSGGGLAAPKAPSDAKGEETAEGDCGAGPEGAPFCAGCCEGGCANGTDANGLFACRLC